MVPSDDSPGDLESITTEPDEENTYSRQTGTETERTLTRPTPALRTLAAVALVGIALPLVVVGIATTWSVIAVGNAAVAAAVAFWLGAQIATRQEADDER